MGRTRYKVPYADYYGLYGGPRQKWLYVSECHTSDTTFIYDEEGNIVLSWSADNEQFARRIVQIINRGHTVLEGQEPWND